ncbi:MAG: class I SAM-dependent methyltransferase [Bacteroidales bacterium]|nr:class I SAM-dependent methyltransferase [Bacteroidales bacterium]
MNLLIEELKQSPIAIGTQEANEQHYEVPAEFFRLVLGPWMKYSCGLWPQGVNTLEESEIKMLDLTISRAGIEDGQRILDLGCGWGSFTLYAALKFPGAHFTAVSNSRSQRLFIEHRARELQLKNVRVITADINDFDPKEKYDRVVSVEMFEHVRNYELLFQRIHSWLNDDGKLFVHIFNHKKFAYKFEIHSDRDWMAKYFFTGGMMPSNHLLFYFANGFQIGGHWVVNGRHYSKTLEAWLRKMDDNKKLIYPLFGDIYGDEARRFWSYWRIFFMACSETFKLNGGNEWQVGHYLFVKK